MLAKLFGKKDKEDTGAKATEKEREKDFWQRNQLSLLERIANAVEGKGPGAKRRFADDDDEGAGGWSIGKGVLAGGIGGAVAAAFAGALPFLLSKIGPAFIITGIALAIKAGFDGWFKSEEWGVRKIAGALGAILGGTKSGWLNALGTGATWAIFGFGIGWKAGKLPGALAGAMIGAVVGLSLIHI